MTTTRTSSPTGLVIVGVLLLLVGVGTAVRGGIELWWSGSGEAAPVAALVLRHDAVMVDMVTGARGERRPVPMTAVSFQLQFGAGPIVHQANVAPVVAAGRYPVGAQVWVYATPDGRRVELEAPTPAFGFGLLIAGCILGVAGLSLLALSRARPPMGPS